MKSGEVKVEGGEQRIENRSFFFQRADLCVSPSQHPCMG